MHINIEELINVQLQDLVCCEIMKSKHIVCIVIGRSFLTIKAEGSKDILQVCCLDQQHLQQYNQQYNQQYQYSNPNDRIGILSRIRGFQGEYEPIALIQDISLRMDCIDQVIYDDNPIQLLRHNRYASQQGRANVIQIAS